MSTQPHIYIINALFSITKVFETTPANTETLSFPFAQSNSDNKRLVQAISKNEAPFLT